MWIRFFSCLLFVLFFLQELPAQRKLSPETREQKKLEKQVRKQKRKNKVPETELRWDLRKLPAKSKGLPEISAWHTGTSGIIASDAAEISLFHPTRIGFSEKTEFLFRIAEEVFLPNIGLKHFWWGNKRFALASEHSLHYTYPGLKILQSTGFKDLIPDSVQINQGFAMRHEILFSWLMNPRTWGCPNPPAEKIFTLRAGSEFYLGKSEISSFDYAHALYHSQLLDGKVLYYGGLQFDSYFGHRFHYSLNGLLYSVDLKKDYVMEANVRLTCYVSRRVGFSASCKLAGLNIDGVREMRCIPLVDFTYLVNPGRSVIKHGLSKRKRIR